MDVPAGAPDERRRHEAISLGAGPTWPGRTIGAGRNVATTAVTRIAHAPAVPCSPSIGRCGGPIPSGPPPPTTASTDRLRRLPSLTRVRSPRSSTLTATRDRRNTTTTPARRSPRESRREAPGRNRYVQLCEHAGSDHALDFHPFGFWSSSATSLPADGKAWPAVGKRAAAALPRRERVQRRRRVRLPAVHALLARVRGGGRRRRREGQRLAERRLPLRCRHARRPALLLLLADRL